MNHRGTGRFWRFLLSLLLLFPGAPPANGVAAAKSAGQVQVEDFQDYSRLDTLKNSVWDIWQHNLSLAKIQVDPVGGPHPLLLPSGQGYAGWNDGRFHSDDIFLQKLDARGNRLWQHDAQVNDDFFTYNRFLNQLLPAPDGGVLLFFSDDRAGVDAFGIYAQRFSASGERLWAHDAQVNASVNSGGRWPSAVLTPQGEVAVAWAKNSTVYLQKLSLSGQRLWSADLQVNAPSALTQVGGRVGLGVDASGDLLVGWYGLTPQASILAQWVNPSGDLLLPQPAEVAPLANLDPNHAVRVLVLADSSALLTWTDELAQGAERELYAQRVSATGSRLWSAPRQVSSGSGWGFRWEFDVLLDASNHLLVWWRGQRQGINDIYYQRLRADGSLVYAADQALLGPPSDPALAVLMAAFNRQGAALVFYHADGCMLAQQIAADGSLLTPNPLIVHELAGRANPGGLRLAAARTGDTWALWEDNRMADGKQRFFVQRLNSAGQHQFALEPSIEGGNTGDWRASRPLIAADPQGLAVIAWEYWLGERREIRVQKMGLDGKFAWPAYQLVRAPTSADLSLDALEVDENGNIFVAFGEQSQVWVQRMDSLGSREWGNGVAVPITPPPSGWQVGRGGTALDSGPGSTLSVAWIMTLDRSEDNGHTTVTNIYAQHLSATGQHLWASDRLVNTRELGDQIIDFLVTGADPSGSTAVIWSINQECLLQTLSAAGAPQFSPEKRLNPPGSTRTLGSAAFDMDRQGLFYVVWTSYRSSLPDGVYAQRMDINGNFVWENDLRVNQQGLAPQWAFGDPRVSASGVTASVGWSTLSLVSGSNVFFNRVQMGAAVAWAADQPAIAFNRFYLRTGYAQSRQLNAGSSPVLSARLDADVLTNGGSARFDLSNDGGKHWSEVSPGDTLTFSTSGADLRWRAALTASADLHYSPQVRQVRVTYVEAAPYQGERLFFPVIGR